MNFVSELPPRQVLPGELTSGQLAALRIVHTYRLGRVKNGWRAPGSPLVTLATMRVLFAKRLVLYRNINGRQGIDVTGTGINTIAVADQRKRGVA